MTRILKVALFIFSLLAGSVFAELSKPEGPVLLTVTGAISESNAMGEAQFDRSMLESLDWREVQTFTSFTSGEQLFAGPTLASLLEALGVSSGILTASAINDYTIEIDARDAFEHGVILAMQHNGRNMRVRDKGPIWLIYPSTEEEAADNLFDAEMIWQLDRIFVE